jgi:hypothetical protein
MKVELKMLAIYPRLSKDSTAFNAVVYVDGEKVGHAENDGHGGETTIYWVASLPRRAEIEATLKKLVPPEFTSARGTEWAIDHLVEAKRAEKETAKHDARLRRRCAKHGTGAARFDVPGPWSTATIWVEYGRGAEIATRTQMTSKHPALQNWTVIA